MTALPEMDLQNLRTLWEIVDLATNVVLDNAEKATMDMLYFVRAYPVAELMKLMAKMATMGSLDSMIKAFREDGVLEVAGTVPLVGPTTKQKGAYLHVGFPKAIDEPNDLSPDQQLV